MDYLTRFRQFSSSLTGHLFIRLFAGLLLLMPPGIFMAGLIIDDVTNKSFVHNAHTIGNLVAEKLDGADPEDFNLLTRTLNRAASLHNIVYADIRFNGKIITATDREVKEIRFVEDQQFGENGDDVFCLAFPLTSLSNGEPATLRLAFDETIVHSAFGDSVNRSLTITYIFMVIAALVVYFVSRSVAAPLQELAHLSREVASGKVHKELKVNTGISEIRKLGADMERMRANLVSQTDKLDTLSKQDLLTGIPNRLVLDDHLEKAALVAQRTNVPFSLLVLDLTRFQEVTDTHGHLAGDMIIQEAAARLYGIVRKSDTVARLGGDEFAVLLQASSGNNLEERIKYIIEEIKKTYIIYGEAVFVGATIGVASFPEHGETATDLLRHADAAKLYAHSHHLDYAFFNSSFSPDSIEVLKLQTELQEFIRRQELLVYYQPKIDLHTGQIEGFEALARWEHPQEGIIGPDVFIPLCEKSESLINELTLYITRRACMDAKKWHAAGYAVNVSVNLSPKNLLREHFNNSLIAVLDELEYDPGLLELELTETQILAEPLQAIQILKKFSNEGIQISIDDFGTGYSSLSYLQKLPIDSIKIDKSFVMELTGADDNSAIVKASIEMAHNLGLKVIAEGVETELIANFLKGWHCDSAQGYYYARPVPFEQTLEILAKDTT